MRLLFILFLFFSYSLNASNYLFYVDNSNNKKVLTTISNIESVIDNANENSQIIFIIGDKASIVLNALGALRVLENRHPRGCYKSRERPRGLFPAYPGR